VLTADLVRARRKGTELVLSALSGKSKTLAVEVATRLIDATRGAEGQMRVDLDDAWRAARLDAPKKLGDGLGKLVEDRCDFEVASELSPGALRLRVFEVAAQLRREATVEAPFSREAVLAEQAGLLGVEVSRLEQCLYADLRSEQRLVSFDEPASAEALVEQYERGQAQAVLLRAVEVVVDVWCADAYAYRALFQKLKFRRLLHRAEARSDGGYRLHIDGPFSVFQASTKYGLALGLSLPAIQACDRYELSAALRWGPEREPLTFKLSGKGGANKATRPGLPDEVAALLERFDRLGSSWAVTPSADILEVKGHGVCVPDLRFTHAETGEVVYLEVLGFWSRAAAFQRVELAQAGLQSRVLFAVSTRLRVSEQLLDDAEVPSELYVYKGTLNAREVLKRLEG